MAFRLNLPNSLGFARIVGAAVFIFVLASLEWPQRELWQSAESLRQAQTTIAASELRARVDRELNVVINLTQAFVAYLETKQGRVDAAEVNALLKRLYSKTNHLHNFAVAVGYRVAYVYPLEGNEPVLGIDYRTYDQQWPTIERAIANRTSVLAGPVPLVQGGLSIIYRVPVFIDGQYWGLVSSVIDARALFQAVGDSERAYAIRSSDSAQGMVWGDASLFNDEHSITVNASMPAVEWQYAVHPVEDASLARQQWLFNLISIIISAALGYFSYLTQYHRYRLYNVSRTDPITKLLNRRALENSLELILERRRKSDQQCALLFIDLDRFKYINDTHGHRAGDALLSMIAERLTNELRAGDIIGRWGGDELVVLVEENNVQVLDNLIARLRGAINQPVLLAGIELRVDASVGCAVFPDDGTNLETLLYIADIRMYQDKQRHYT